MSQKVNDVNQFFSLCEIQGTAVPEGTQFVIVSHSDQSGTEVKFAKDATSLNTFGNVVGVLHVPTMTAQFASE